MIGRRFVLALAGLLGASVLAACVMASPRYPTGLPCAVRYLGQANLANGAGFDGLPVGGLSGIDRDPDSGRYWAISDDRSSHGPARIYELEIDSARFERRNDAGPEAITVLRQSLLRDRFGATYPRMMVDPEAVRLIPGRPHLLYSFEGERSNRRMMAPGVREIDRDGRLIREFELPRYFVPIGGASGKGPRDRGLRNNLGFEALAVSPDGRFAYAGLEGALIQDGPTSQSRESSPARIIEYEIATGRPRAQFVYPVEPLLSRPLGAFDLDENGLVELLALGGRRFLALERRFVLGHGMGVRLYWVDAGEATDVGTEPRLDRVDVRPVRKQLLLDLAELRNDDGSSVGLSNIEGLSFGPPGRGGRPTLILVADNNFSFLLSSQFIGLEISDRAALERGELAGLCANDPSAPR